MHPAACNFLLPPAVGRPLPLNAPVDSFAVQRKPLNGHFLAALWRKVGANATMGPGPDAAGELQRERRTISEIATKRDQE